MDSAQLVPVRRAFLSVSDTHGLVEFGRGLSEQSVELIATEGTRAALTEGGVAARTSEELTGVGSWFGGRIKTLHPGILGGILAPRTPEGVEELARRGLVPIDLVAVNFYPFARHLDRPIDSGEREEFIDIGGVTLARAAAKNHASVVVATDPADYPTVLGEMKRLRGAVSAETRRRLAVATFRRCAEYDRTIAGGLEPSMEQPEAFPAPKLEFRADALQLRYGENPHQRATVFALSTPGSSPEPVRLALVKGEALSYTNLLDLDTAERIVQEFSEPAAAVVKHATPCGAATGASVREALERAVSTDPVARYGCAIAVNRAFSKEAVPALHGIFVDLLAAPSVDAMAFQALERRPKLKIVEIDPSEGSRVSWESHSALGRLLVQEADHRQLDPREIRWATHRSASEVEARAMAFAWKVVRHAKSNAVVLAQGSSTVGIGSGQPTRVKAVELAVEVAGARAKGAVLASDAFFPFADGVEAAARAGVTAILQPGGSVRDAEVIAAADRANIAMGFTGWRVFRH